MKKGLYNRFWRWHFYAALFMMPLLITLTISGIGYLFYNDVEDNLYDDVFFGKSKVEEKLSIDEGIAKAVEENKGYSLSKVIVLDDPYNKRLTLSNEEGDQKYLFLDENNQIVGDQNAAYTFSNIMRNLHSSLFVGGTVVNYLVELAACWAIFLLISGVYMSLKGNALRKKQDSTKNQRNKKYHALTGIIITIPMIAIIFTGLPWSAFMGNFIYSASQEHPSIGFPVLAQQPPTSESSEVPWATRKNEAPSSDDPHAHHNGHGMTTANSKTIKVEQLMKSAQEAKIAKPYSIVLPQAEDEVYTVAKSSNTGITGLDVSPAAEVTAYFDQYSGKLLGKVGYDEYGILAKWFTWGIPLHEGHLFGWPNKIINLAVCLGFLLVLYWGVKTWLTRKKASLFSAPPKTTARVSISFIAIMAVLGIIMPLFGISLIIALLLEGILTAAKRKQITANH
ncbi:PepSY-associated TM helix domain-containing protein [Bacillus massilinigeriensis]|uniref:PepSY-associated TM helix domain-containing protein n=1 Tax=Bacillus mediterraneensis TaxID=1805474 RepID=UPI0008F805B8|nr:PepSY domain-containing protein [Bacillus mediterraneensis]